MAEPWWKRVSASIALCAGGALLLTACLPPGIACPAIGYISSVEVQVDGAVAFIDACAGVECSSSPMALVVISEKMPGVWSVEFHAGPSDALTLLAYNADGELIAEEEYELEWTPVGDPGPCPGPVETPALEFSVR